MILANKKLTLLMVLMTVIGVGFIWSRQTFQAAEKPARLQQAPAVIGHWVVDLRQRTSPRGDASLRSHGRHSVKEGSADGHGVNR